MYSRSTVVRPIGERFTSLLDAMALPGFYFTDFLLLPYCKLFIIPNLLPFSGGFVHFFPQDRFVQCSFPWLVRLNSEI